MTDFQLIGVWFNQENFSIMPVKIRLARRGRKKKPYYHIVVADARAPRDGRFIENLGSYNPMTKPASIELDVDKAFSWLEKGAQPTDTARAILRFKGVLYKKHLQRGVKKGALTQEQADAKLTEWIDAKEAKVAARVAATAEAVEQFRKEVSGVAKKKEVVADTTEAQEAFRGEEEAPASDVEAVADAPVAEETPAAPEAAVEAVTEAVAEEAPAVVEATEETVEAVAEAKEEVAEAVEEVKEEVAEAKEAVAEAVAEETPAASEEE